jgi:predicted nuclease of predicted toxin-antitoxin system
MRLLLDECLSHVIAEQLRRRGYDVVSVQEIDRRNLSDAEQMGYAAEQRRAFVTYNVVHFEELIIDWFEQGRSHYGVILIKEESIRRNDFGGLIRALAALLDRYPAEDALVNGCLFLQPV